MGNTVPAKLEGKVAIVTGAAKGIGRAIAERYAAYGAKVCLTDVDEQVEKAAQEIAVKHHIETMAIVCDVRDREQMDAAAKACYEQLGAIDIACPNAGICKLCNFLDMSDELRDAHIDINIKGVWNTCQAVIPYMLKEGKGSIVIASSVTGDLVADPGESAYALSKAALVGLTKALAIEFAPEHIRVNCTQLGYARTPMSEFMAEQSNPENPEQVFEDMSRGIPLKRLADPEEVGELFAFLGSDESSYLTGSQIVIDGGSTLPETMSIGTD